MSGTLVGEPYCGEDWAGRGRKIYYMDMQPDYYVHTDKVPTYVSTEYLLRELFMKKAINLMRCVSMLRPRKKTLLIGFMLNLKYWEVYLVLFYRYLLEMKRRMVLL